MRESETLLPNSMIFKVKTKNPHLSNVKKLSLRTFPLFKNSSTTTLSSRILRSLMKELVESMMRFLICPTRESLPKYLEEISMILMNLEYLSTQFQVKS